MAKGGKSKANSKTAMHALMLQEVEHMQEIVSFCQRVRAVMSCDTLSDFGALSQLRTVRSTLQNLLLTISGAVPFNEKASKVSFVDADVQQV